MYDLLIKGGILVDGTKRARVQADLAIENRRIARIAQDIKDEAAAPVSLMCILMTILYFRGILLMSQNSVKE